MDYALLRLKHRPEAVASIGPLAWELPYAMRAALKKKKKKEIGAENQQEARADQKVHQRGSCRTGAPQRELRSQGANKGALGNAGAVRWERGGGRPSIGGVSSTGRTSA